MKNNLSNYRKAHTLEEVDNAVQFNVPIDADHEFFTDFRDVRGDFEDRMIYKSLNVNPKTFVFNRKINRGNKTLLFLAGMRGSGKTSELAKIAKKLQNPEGFFCVVCNLDTGLDVNDMEYMDILIFQLERLFEEIHNEDHKLNKFIDLGVVKSMKKWFEERVQEANKVIKAEGGFTVQVEAGTPSILKSFWGLTTKLRGSITGSKENAQKIRTVFKTNFREFALKFNEFIASTNYTLREHGIAKEILFIVDGLEKIATIDIRRKIVDHESNRLQQIKVHTIFTLPIELMSLRQKLITFSTVVSFPFVKICEKDGTIVEPAMERFIEFVYKRIDEKVFDNQETVRKAIQYCGGSPRELLRILEYAYLYADDDQGIIDATALNKGLKKLAAESSQYLSPEDLAQLQILKHNNAAGIPTPFGLGWQDLLEKLIIMEYNDGTYKRVNPVVEASQLYQQYVK